MWDAQKQMLNNIEYECNYLFGYIWKVEANRGNGIEQEISNRKASSSTISSFDRMRKMSRDTIPNIENYRTQYQVKMTTRPSLHELYDPNSNDEEVITVNSNVYTKQCSVFTTKSPTRIPRKKFKKLQSRLLSSDGSKECSSATWWAFGALCFSCAFPGWLPKRA